MRLGIAPNWMFCESKHYRPSAIIGAAAVFAAVTLSDRVQGLNGVSWPDGAAASPGAALHSAATAVAVV